MSTLGRGISGYKASYQINNTGSFLVLLNEPTASPPVIKRSSFYRSNSSLCAMGRITLVNCEELDNGCGFGGAFLCKIIS